jgi:hypothetical protein
MNATSQLGHLPSTRRYGEKITGKRASPYIQAGFWAIVVLVVLHMVGPMFGLHLGAPIPGKVTAVGFACG